MTPIERVARVLNPAAFKPPLDKPGHRLVRENQRRLALERARAVLQVLREPSEGMIEAWHSGLDDYYPNANSVKAGYQAMIDAALSE